MHRLVWLSLFVITALILVAGCPRKQPTDSNTPPVVSDRTRPATPPAETPATPEDPAAVPDATTPPIEGEVTPPVDPNATPETTPPAETPPPTPKGVTTVILETTKGNIVLEVHPEWSPKGAAHFFELVNAKFYDGAPWFRVIDGFVAQCGISADPALNAQWGEKTIMDEPVVQGNLPGYVAFGKSSAPNSRSTHFFINYGDNTASLDGTGFPCFAKVTEGMDVALKLYKAEYGDQQGLGMPGGLDTFKKMFPQADFIKKAYIKK